MTTEYKTWSRIGFWTGKKKVVIKDIIQTIGAILIWMQLDDRTVSVLHILILIIILWLYKIIFLFIKITVKCEMFRENEEWCL